MSKILYRYIFREIAGLFVLVLGIFLFVLIMGQILKVVEMIVRHRVSPWDIFRMLAYLIPYLLPLAIPMAALISMVVCFSRLSGDLEITALGASGISLYQLLPPMVLFAGVMFVASLFLTLHWGPWGAYALRQMASRMAKEHISVIVKEGVFNEVFPGLVVYADRVRVGDGLMEGVFIHDDRSADVPFQILARKGFFGRRQPTGDAVFFRLEHGTIYQSSPEDGKVRRIGFEEYEINLDLAISEADEHLRRTRRKELETKSLLKKIQRRKERKRPTGQYLVELHRRLSIPVTCLVFCFLALPLGLQTRPQGKSHGFLLGSLVILIYYLLFSAGQTVAENGRVPAWIALWSPNFLFALFTLLLLVRTARERPSVVLIRINTMVDFLQKLAKRLLEGRG